MFMFATCEFVRTFEVMVVFVKHQITAMCFNKSFYFNCQHSVSVLQL